MLVVEDTEIADNVSSPFPGEPNPSEGGGVHVEDNATGTFTRVRVLRNQAGTGGGLNAYRGRYDIVDSVIDANRATTGFGGGVTASSNFATPQMPASMINLTTTLVRNNAAPIGGGIAIVGDNFSNERASLSLTGSVVSGNQSQNQGGGILVSRTVFSSSNSLIINNTVTGGSTPFGGGILIISSSTASISGTTIAQNTAAQHGGGIFANDQSAVNISYSNIYGNSAGTRGGGIFLGAGQTGTIQNSIFADNTGVQPSSQIHEDACNAVNYPNNLITAPAFSGCSDACVAGAGTKLRHSEIRAFPRGARRRDIRDAGVERRARDGRDRRRSRELHRSERNGGRDTVGVGAYTLTATASSANGGNYGPVSAGFVVVRPPSAAGAASLTAISTATDKSDVAVFRPSTGAWHILRSSSLTGIAPIWGGGGDIPLRGDFDGDGRADLAVFRPSTGAWLIVRSSTSTGLTQTWGGGGDIPVPRDYDGDGKTDIAIFRPSTGAWWIINSSTGIGSAYTFGGGGDMPVPEDYDGDGKADVAIFRPATGAWYIVRSSNQAGMVLTWGGGGDVPVPGDYDGDGKADIAIFRRSNGSLVHRAVEHTNGYHNDLGRRDDVAVPGDYDGDGKTDIAVFRPIDRGLVHRAVE